MKDFIKNNTKAVISFVLGAVLLGGGTVAANEYASKQEEPKKEIKQVENIKEEPKKEVKPMTVNEPTNPTPVEPTEPTTPVEPTTPEPPIEPTPKVDFGTPQNPLSNNSPLKGGMVVMSNITVKTVKDNEWFLAWDNVRGVNCEIRYYNPNADTIYKEGTTVDLKLIVDCLPDGSYTGNLVD